MAAVEDLEIIVTVDLSRALEDLRDLQDELQEVADDIDALRTEAAKGISVNTNVESLTDDLARLRTEIETFERATEVNVGASVGGTAVAAGGAGAVSGGGGGGVTDRLIPNYDYSFGGGNQADNVQDLMGSLGFRRNTSGGGSNKSIVQRAFSGLGNQVEKVQKTMSEFDLRMSDLHNMLARLVPLIFVFIGAIPAVVASLYGLAVAAAAAGAALLAIGGLGAVGFAMDGGEFNGQRLSDALSGVADDFLDAFAPLANQLQPIFEDALSGLESLFDSIASQGDALMALEDEARGFGQFILSFVPDMLRTMAGLVEGMGEVFGDIGGFLQANFEQVIRGTLVATRQTIPVVAQLAQTIANMLPAIIRISTGFLQVVNIIMAFVGLLGRLISALGVSARGFGVVIAGALAVSSAVLLAKTALLGLIYRGLAGFVGMVYAKAVPAAATLTASFTSTAMGAALATGAVASLITLLTLGAGLALVSVATAAAAKFTSMAGSIDDATSALKDFNRVQNGMNDSGFGSGDGEPYGFNPDESETRQRGGSSVNVFNVESSGDPEEDRSNIEHADWLSGRTTK